MSEPRPRGKCSGMDSCKMSWMESTVGGPPRSGPTYWQWSTSTSRAALSGNGQMSRAKRPWGMGRNATFGASPASARIWGASGSVA